MELGETQPVDNIHGVMIMLSMSEISRHGQMPPFVLLQESKYNKRHCVVRADSTAFFAYRLKKVDKKKYLFHSYLFVCMSKLTL